MKLNLTEKQLKRLLSGKNIQLRHCDIGADGIEISNQADPYFIKKLQQSQQTGKGFRLTPAQAQGAGILSTLKKFGRTKLKLSNGDMNAIGSFMQPILRAGRNSSQKALTDLADEAPRVAGQRALEALKGGSVQSRIRKLTGLSKKDMRSVNNFMKPILRAGRKSSQKALTDLADEAPRVAGERALEALRGGSVNPYLPTKYLNQSGGSIKPTKSRVYTDEKPTLRKDQSGFVVPAEFAAPRPNQQSFNGRGFRN